MLVVRLVQHLPTSVVAFILQAQLCDAESAVVNQGETDVWWEGDPRGEERGERVRIPLKPDHLGCFFGDISA